MAQSSPIKTVSTAGSSSANLIKQQLEKMIFNGDFATGERINETSIAEQLGVSRAPVREAFRSLEAEGLVKIIPKRGVFVRSLSLEEALDLYDVRAGLATAIGRLLAHRITNEQLDHLQQLQTQMSDAALQGDIEAYQQINLEFHETLAANTANERLIQMDEGLSKELSLFLYKGVFRPAQLRASQHEHQKLLDAIAAGDSEAASLAFEKHILAGKQRMMETVLISKSSLRNK